MLVLNMRSELNLAPPFQMMVYNGVAAVLYLTAFATNAAHVPPKGFFYDGHLGAAAVRFSDPDPV